MITSSQQQPPTNLLDQARTLLYILGVAGRSVLRRVSHPTELGVRTLVITEEHVLLVRHRAGLCPWSLPGGAVNKRETLVDAACREVWEETGCTIRIEHLHGIFHNFRAGFSNHIAVFTATPLNPPQPPAGSLEIADARLVPLHALPAGVDQGSCLRIAEYQRGARGLLEQW
ncbi:MAG: NUDIX domain-containing protein [Chloroflexaceae bacterium]|nr:NUDIX domain-containing protein [Chloroflexaceae bacterium]